MAKRKREWTEEKIARYQQQRKGMGEGAAYKPWLTIQDVPSSGRAHRIYGTKTNRIHHLLSDLERDYFYLLDWADNVVDIREQFPLNREITTRIAEEKSISHPEDRITKTPLVMTTDFLITIRQASQTFVLARTLKPSEQLENPRTIEKFDIERVYWEEKGIDWAIVTEKDLPVEICRNIGRFQGYKRIEQPMLEIVEELFEYVRRRKGGLSRLFAQFEEEYALESGTALHCFKYLVASKFITFDMKSPFSVRKETSDFTFVEVAHGQEWGA